jgi:hypothetical protein
MCAFQVVWMSDSMYEWQWAEASECRGSTKDTSWLIPYSHYRSIVWVVLALRNV